MTDTYPENAVRVFDQTALELDAEAEAQRITDALCDTIHDQLHRQGAVVGISGGIDSSVVLALCARALGPDAVLGVMLPDDAQVSIFTPTQVPTPA